MLQEIPLPETAVVPDTRMQAFVADARRRVADHLASPHYVPAKGLVPSDERQVLAALQSVRRMLPDVRSFLEWGAGFGVATGIAALLGMEAYGVEIEPDLVDTGRQLLSDHGVRAQIVCGSFVPSEFQDSENLSDLESRIVLHGEPAYQHMDMDLSDFELVFAYPWPTEVELYLRMFEHGADHGAHLLLASNAEGARLFRKDAG